MSFKDSMLNCKFWIKNTFFVKPAMWIDSKTSEQHGRTMYKWSKRLFWWSTLVVFPLLFIIFASLTIQVVNSSNGSVDWGTVVFNGPAKAAAIYTMGAFAGFWLLFGISWFWFSKFNDVPLPVIADNAKVEAAIVATETKADEAKKVVVVKEVATKKVTTNKKPAPKKVAVKKAVVRKPAAKKTTSTSGKRKVGK